MQLQSYLRCNCKSLRARNRIDIPRALYLPYTIYVHKLKSMIDLRKSDFISYPSAFYYSPNVLCRTKNSAPQ